MTQPKVTHGFSSSVDEEDGVTRSITVQRLDNEGFQLQISTIWYPGAEPLVTQISFSAKGFNLLASAMDVAMHDIDRFRVPVEGEAA